MSEILIRNSSTATFTQIPNHKTSTKKNDISKQYSKQALRQGKLREITKCLNSAFVGQEEDLGGCYPPRPLASLDNTLPDLLNSSLYPTQPHSLIAKYKCNKSITYTAQISSAYDQMHITYNMWFSAISAVIIKAEQVVLSFSIIIIIIKTS